MLQVSSCLFKIANKERCPVLIDSIDDAIIASTFVAKLRGETEATVIMQHGLQVIIARRLQEKLTSLTFWMQANEVLSVTP